MQWQCQVGLHVQFFNQKKEKHLTTEYRRPLQTAYAKHCPLPNFQPRAIIIFFFLEEKLNTVMPWRMINSKLATFKPLFAFFLAGSEGE